MVDDELTPEQLAARRRASAQDATSDLSRMGVDPTLLGLQAPPRGDPQSRPSPPPRDNAGSPSVVPLRPEYAAAEQAPGPPATSASAPRAVALRPAPVSPPSVPPVAGGTAGAVEELLARTHADRPAPRPARRWLTAVTFGLVTPDAAEAANNEQFLLGAVRTRQSDRRVVAFAAGKGGVGTTSVALGVGLTLAAVRDDHTVLVDCHTGTPSLAQLQGQQVAPNARDLVMAGSGLAPARLPGGLHIVDGCDWRAPLGRQDTVPLLDQMRRDFAFTLVDVGNDPSEAARAALARSDQTVVVSGSGRWGLASAQVASTRLRQLDPFAAERAVYVVLCRQDDSYRRVHREVMAQLARGPVRVVVVPPDPVLGTGQPFDPAQVRPATREAVLEVAAAVAVSGGVH